MEQSETVNKVIKLGKLLIRELKLEDSGDTLGRWMAFYIAEKIAVAKKAQGEKRITAEKDCMETILAVWKHRWELAPNVRPLRNFQPILETLQMISPESTSSYHFQDGFDAEAIEKDSLQAAVKEIDKGTKTCLSYLLSKAAKEASTEDTAGWLDSAGNLDAQGDLDIIGTLLSGEKYSLSPDAASQRWNYEQDYAIAKLETQLKAIERLESHTRDIKAQLKADITYAKSNKNK